MGILKDMKSLLKYHNWSNKGVALRNQGHDDTIKAYDNALRLDLNNSKAWYNKRKALKALGRTY
jgi:tetratricopeptide (TPR) repeat protein